MKAIIFILSIIVLMGCSKNKKDLCRYEYYNRPGYIAFSNTSFNDLDTLILTQFKANDSFNTIFSIDTFINIDHYQAGSLFVLGGVNLQLDQSHDKEVFLPNVGKSFRISLVTYSGPDYFEVEEYGCLSRTFVRGPEKAKVNGVFYPVENKDYEVTLAINVR